MITNDLLGFVLNMFSDPAAAESYKNDPEGTLDHAGFGRMCSDDVDAIMPVLLDHSPISFDRNYNTGGNSAWGGGAGGGSNGGGGAGGAGGSGGAGGTGGGGGGGTGGGGGGGGTGWAADHAAAVQQLTHVLNNYSYTSIDDRDIILDQSVNQNIWNSDVKQLFDNDADIKVIDDRDVDNSTVYSNSFNDNSKDDHSVDDHSDHSVETKFENDLEVKVEIKDSFNPDSSDHSVDDHTDNSIDDHSDNSTDDHTDKSVDVGDVDVEYYKESIVIDEFEYEDESINDSIVLEEVKMDDPVVVVVP
jgi:hypothetical protein